MSTMTTPPSPPPAIAAATATAPTTNTFSRSFYRRPLPESCVAFSSPPGRRLFDSALKHHGLKSFFALMEQYSTQSEPAYCGMSTLVVVLNALAVDPRQTWKGPWRWYDERMLNCCVDLEEVKQTGITLRTFACLAHCQGIQAHVHYVDDAPHTLDHFRATVQRACNEDQSSDSNKKEDTTAINNAFLVVSYNRKVLGQTGSGHFSPLAAYDAQSDHVLILDLARFKYGAHWVPISLLYEAMQSMDPDTGRSRGYVMLKRVEEANHVSLDVSMPRSMLFLSRMSKNPIRKSYKEYLDQLGHEITWDETVQYWTQGGKELNYIWNILEAQPKHCMDSEDCDQETLSKLLECLDMITPENSLLDSNEQCCGGRPGYLRTLPITTAQAIYITYLASTSPATRQSVLGSLENIPDEIMRQLEAEATLIQYALESSTQTIDSA
jgi:glutathione gamma-glutamylcysteinyltransferase